MPSIPASVSSGAEATAYESTYPVRASDARTIVRRPRASRSPSTTTRRLSGPFDYLLPERRWRSARSCACRSGTRGSTASWSELAPTTEVAAERLVAPTCGARRLDPGRPRRPGAVDGGRVLLDAGARAQPRDAAARARPKTAVLGRGRPNGGRPRSTTTSARCSSACRARPAAIWPRCGGWRSAAWCAIAERVERRAPRTNPSPDVARRADRRAARRRWRRSRRRRARRGCCTA